MLSVLSLTIIPSTVRGELKWVAYSPTVFREQGELLENDVRRRFVPRVVVESINLRKVILTRFILIEYSEKFWPRYKSFMSKSYR